jgi:hypothetical protein
MNFQVWILRSGVLGLMAILVAASCALFAPPGASHIAMDIEELSNGYLIHIVTTRPVGEVSTVISSGNWLLITIADSTIAPPSLETVHSPLVDSVEVTAFPTAFQLSMHLTMAVDAVDVIHRIPSTDIMVSLFVKDRRPAAPG